MISLVCSRALILTTDSPCDVDIEECEDGNDDTEDGCDEIFGCEDPGRW